MADLSEVYTALRNADKAGDTVAAEKLAAYLKSAGGNTPASGVPVEPGANTAPTNTRDPSFLEHVAAIPETALALGGSITGHLGGMAGAAAAGLKEAASGAATGSFKDVGKKISEGYDTGAATWGYAPQTQAGKAQVGAIGDFMNRNITPVAPMIGELAQVGHAGQIAGKAAPQVIADTARGAATVGGDIARGTGVPKAVQAVGSAAMAAGRVPVNAIKAFREDTDTVGAQLFKRVAGVEGLTPKQKEALSLEIMNTVADAPTMQDAEAALSKSLDARGLKLKENADLAQRKAEELNQRADLAHQVIGPSSTVSDIGRAIYDEAASKKGIESQKRAANADVNYKAAETQAAAKEAQGQFASDTPAYKELVDDLTKRREDTVVPALKTAIDTVLTSLKPKEGPAPVDTRLANPSGGFFGEAPKGEIKNPSFNALEELRRFIGERAKGLPSEGFDAIGQDLARDIKEGLTKSLEQHADGFENYLKQYREDSKSLAAYRTTRGKSATAHDEVDWEEAKTDPSKLPARFMATKQGVGELTAVLGGDRARALELAKTYLSTELSKISTAKGAEAAVKGKFRELLDEFPEARPSVDQYLKNLKSSREAAKGLEKFGSTAMNRAEQMQKDAGERLAPIVKQKMLAVRNVGEMRQLANDLRNTPGGMKALHDMVNVVVKELPADELLAKWDTTIKPAVLAGDAHSPLEMAKMDNVVYQLRQISQQKNLSAKDFNPLIDAHMKPIKRDTTIAIALGSILSGGMLGSAGHALGAIGAGAAGGVGGILAGRANLRMHELAIKTAIDKMIADPALADEYLAKPTPANVKAVLKEIKP